jgi:hypothetical protein
MLPVEIIQNHVHGKRNDSDASEEDEQYPSNEKNEVEDNEHEIGFIWDSHFVFVIGGNN